MTDTRDQGLGRLDGRVAIVTGAGQGVGRGIALRLASEGARVIVAARRAETGEPVADEIRARGGLAECVVTDVSVRASIEACVAGVLDRHGRLEIVVHNALAGAIPHRLEDVRLDEHWVPMSLTSAWASFWCAQAASGPLRVAGARGRYVMITSPSAVEGSNNIPLYSPAKASQRSLAKCLAKQWGPHGITVNCIAPVAESPALAGAFAGNPALKAAMEARTPLGRVGDPERDIGSVAVFLASDDSAYVTGQTIVCDGGSFLGL